MTRTFTSWMPPAERKPRVEFALHLTCGACSREDCHAACCRDCVPADWTLVSVDSRCCEWALCCWWWVRCWWLFPSSPSGGCANSWTRTWCVPSTRSVRAPPCCVCGCVCV